MVLNRGSGAGKAGIRWDRYGKRIIEIAGLEAEDLTIVEGEVDVEKCLKEAMDEGETFFVAAGGDGTFNRMVTGLMRAEGKLGQDIILGAIGLGSSNDLHKPLDGRKVVEGIPLRLDRERSPKANIVRIRTLDVEGAEKVSYSVVNSSFGIISMGNRIFNRPHGLTAFLKKVWTPLGIYSAAVMAVVGFDPFNCRLFLDGKEKSTSVTNLSILLNPHFTGDLEYDTPIDQYTDHFLVNLAEGMGVFGRLNLFIRMIRGKFIGNPKCHSWKVKEFVVVPDSPIGIEYDGEVDVVSRAEFALIRGGIRICA